MSNYIRIYDYNATDVDFAGNGLAVLTDAADVAETLEVNGDRTLTFRLVGRERLSVIREERIASLNGQRYRIKKIEGATVTATAIYNDASYKHIQFMEDMIGKTPREIMCELFKDTPVIILPESGLPNGMEWVTDLTDFFAAGKITPIGGLVSLMETLDKYKVHNELYVDNYKIALVKQIGVNKGARLDTAYNAKGIQITRDTTEMVTRLYPYGKDDLHIGSVNGGIQYIDSEYYAQYPREGYMDFSEIEDPKELLEAAKMQFAEDNPDRIDIPKYSVSSEYAERKLDEIGLGDTVTVVDRDFCGMTSLQRVRSITRYPLERQKSTLNLGNPPKSVTDVFKGMVDSTTQYEKSINAKGEVRPQWLENIKEAYSTEITKALTEDSGTESRRTVIHDYGDVWVNPENPEQALAIVGGVIAMANGKNEKGDWNWTAFGDWTGFTADVINAGKIKTANVQIVSDDDENLSISGTLIKMTDNNNKERLILGLQNGRYAFVLNNAAGENVLNVDDIGNITMKGVLDTRREEEGEIGYIIDGYNILGMMYENGTFIPHGLTVSENNYGNHLSLYVNGTEHLHLHAVMVDDDGNITEDGSGKRAIRYCVNNTGTLTDEDGNVFDSLVVFESVEGDTGASTRAYGEWDFSKASVTGLNNGNTASGTLTLASASAYSPNVKIVVENGLITSITPVV